MSRYEREDAGGRPDVVELGQAIEAITLDFGNTLVPFPATSGQDVLAAAAERCLTKWGFAAEEFTRVWAEERRRQLEEDVPEGREAEIPVRVARVLARLRGCSAPPPGSRWDDAVAWERAGEGDVRFLTDAYVDAFVHLTPVPPEIGPLLALLATRYELAILSNWPIAEAIERYVEAAGWSGSLSAIVVSEKVGAIKPQRAIFDAAALALGVASGPRMLHVGDDLGADVGGAHAAGWRAAWVRIRPADTPLPVAPTSGDERPDLTVDRVVDLPRALGMGQGRRPRDTRP